MIGPVMTCGMRLIHHARSELGWSPSLTLDEGLERTVHWYLNNREWWEPLQSKQGVGTRLGTL